MRYGCCLNMIAEGDDITGIDHLDELAAMGYDYAELPLTQMMELSDTAFSELAARVAASPIACETCNNFLPGTFQLTGPDADAAPVLEYADRAFARVAPLGVKIVVFGSAGAKMLPEGWPEERGYEQLAAFLQELDPICQRYGISIAIEPLERGECNIVNSFAEGVKLARLTDRATTRVLVDFYHLFLESEPVQHLVDEGAEFLSHVHFANPAGRVFPTSPDECDYQSFAQAIKAAGYDARVSCEAYTNDFASAGPKTLALFHELFD